MPFFGDFLAEKRGPFSLPKKATRTRSVPFTAQQSPSPISLQFSMVFLSLSFLGRISKGKKASLHTKEIDLNVAQVESR